MDLFGTEPWRRGSRRRPGDPRPGRTPLGCAVIEVMVSIYLMAALAAAPGALESARDRQDRAALEKQVSELSAAAQKAPHDADAQYRVALAASYLAEVSLELHDKNQAERVAESGIQAAERAIAINSRNAEYYRVLGTLCGQVVPANLLSAFSYGKRARDAINKALELDPKSSQAYLARGVGNYYLPDALGGGACWPSRIFGRPPTWTRPPRKPAYGWGWPCAKSIIMPTPARRLRRRCAWIPRASGSNSSWRRRPRNEEPRAGGGDSGDRRAHLGSVSGPHLASTGYPDLRPYPGASARPGGAAARHAGRAPARFLHAVRRDRAVARPRHRPGLSRSARRRADRYARAGNLGPVSDGRRAGALGAGLAAGGGDRLSGRDHCRPGRALDRDRAGPPRLRRAAAASGDRTDRARLGLGGRNRRFGGLSDASADGDSVLGRVLCAGTDVPQVAAPQVPGFCAAGGRVHRAGGRGPLSGGRQRSAAIFFGDPSVD